MPGRCDICGVEALEGQEFAEECLPFRRPKRYCQSCHARFTNRVCLIWFAVAVGFGLLGIGFAWLRGQSLWGSTSAWIALLLVLQWVMIVPHELGHALAARLLGYGQIRILIGYGRPVFTAELMGIQWLFNTVPFGGLTVAGDWPTTRSRWKAIAFVAAGPAVSVMAVAVAWVFVEQGTLFDGTKTVWEAFFWANLLVLGENLFPHTINTPFGRSQNDGLLLWNMVFRWGKPPPPDAQPIPQWEVWLCLVLKWAVVFMTGGATLLLGVIATVPFWYSGRQVSFGAKLFVAGVCLAVMFVVGWITVRLVRQPIARVRKRPPTPPAIHAMEDLQTRSQWLKDPQEADQIATQAQAGKFDEVLATLDAALTRFPNDVLLLTQKGEYYIRLHDFARAELAYDAVLVSLADPNSAAHPVLLAAKLNCILKQGHVDRVEQGCQHYVASPAKAAEKIQVIDQVVCTDLFEESPQFLTRIERWARMALELAPDTLTLKGTLGGVLTEQGKFAEAEPLLRDCYERSTALHDRAFASLYLGKIALHEGNFRTARELFKQAMILHTEPRLLHKAKLGLQECDRLQAGG